MATTQIQVTAADNEFMLIASTPAGSSTLLHYKSGFNKPVNVTVFPGAILATGNYSLTMVGINWGGPSQYTVIVTTDGKPVTYTGGGPTTVGVVWSNTVPMAVTSGQ